VGSDCIGAVVILMSLMADYKSGAVKLIPLNVHLWLMAWQVPCCYFLLRFLVFYGSTLFLA
jgi:hypothetical protein